MHRGLAWALLVLLAAAPIGAAEAKKNRTDAMRQYVYLKDDAELFVGEGVAEMKDFGGSVPKTLESARVRAKAALAEAVRARISSSTTEQLSAKNGKVTESLSSTANSSADVSLENMKLKELVDFPEDGQVTVLATVAKEDYRRQLAGKGPRVYRPEFGLRLGVVVSSYFDLDKFSKDESTLSRSGVPMDSGGSSKGVGGHGLDSLMGFGLEFRFRDWALELDQALAENVTIYRYDPTTKLYSSSSRNAETLGLEGGYDWTPWPWRVQPFVPLRLRAHHLSIGDHSGWDYAASAGLGLRYWPNDSLAFEASGRWLQGLNAAELQFQGQPLLLGPDKTAAMSLTGAQWQISLMWSGF